MSNKIIQDAPYTLIPIHDPKTYKQMAEVYLKDYEIDRIRRYGQVRVAIKDPIRLMGTSPVDPMEYGACQSDYVLAWE